MLAVASEKFGEDRAVKEYAQARGRSKIRNLLVGQLSPGHQHKFDGFIGSIDYWRDESSHGKASDIGETEAFVALHSLLRFARYPSDTFPKKT